MAKMKSVQVSKIGKFDLVEREIPAPDPHQVRIRVEACGVCHSDFYTYDGVWPNIQYPRVPGHEVAGVIDAVGADVTQWKKGQRVGVGWAGWRCGQCVNCRRGDFINCIKHQVTGIHYDGGYTEYMIAPIEALAAIPDKLSFVEAAPLLCAGITTFNALRNSVARAGDLVAILGIGGLGHLAVQFANKMGFETVAISKGPDKEVLAKQLGAHIYINTENNNAADELQKLGGARVILSTAPSAKAAEQMVDGLGVKGELVVVGASMEPMSIAPTQLIRFKRKVCGWPSGTAIDSEETMKFCALTGIRPMIETFSLEKAEDAYNQMITGAARFRAVLKCH